MADKHENEQEFADGIPMSTAIATLMDHINALESWRNAVIECLSTHKKRMDEFMGLADILKVYGHLISDVGKEEVKNLLLETKVMALEELLDSYVNVLRPAIHDHPNWSTNPSDYLSATLPGIIDRAATLDDLLKDIKDPEVDNGEIILKMNGLADKFGPKKEGESK